MSKTYIGIDPGSKGYITSISDNSIDYISISDNTMNEISKMLLDIKYENRGNVICVMEEVHAIYGSSAGATFSFGEIFGILKGLLIALEIPYSLIPPKKWQSEIWNHSDEVRRYDRGGKSIIDTKSTSINAALRLYPNECLKRTEACKKIDDNKVDSLLLATYAKRKNL